MRKRDKVLISPFGNDPKEWAEYKIKEAAYHKRFSRKEKFRKTIKLIGNVILWLCAVIGAAGTVYQIFVK